MSSTVIGLRMNKRTFISFVICCLTLSTSYASEPDRSKGISVHALPERVAKISGSPWGFVVAYAPYLKKESGQPYLQSVKDVLSYIKKQNPSVVENGFWVVTTHPQAYSKKEIKFQNQVKEALPKEKIPLFWVRGSELKKGFKRY